MSFNLYVSLTQNKFNCMRSKINLEWKKVRFEIFVLVFDSAIIDFKEDRKLGITLDTLRIFVDANRTVGIKTLEYYKCFR